MNNDEVIKLLEEGLSWVNAYFQEYEKGMCRNPRYVEAHSKSVRILHVLTPMGVAMAGNEFDPYKD